MTWLRTMVFLMIAGFASSGDANELIGAEPWEIIHIAREFGAADVTRDALKEPMIVGVMDDVSYSMVFHGCYLGRDCSVILFKTRLKRDDWTKSPPPLEFYRAWNRQKLFGRAYRDDDGAAVLEHPVNMTGGVAKETLRDMFKRWRDISREFSNYLGN